MQTARHMPRPSIHHLFRYLWGTPDLPVIHWSSKNYLKLQGYCDSSYRNAGAQGRMRSTTGTMIFIANGLDHFSSNLPKIIASSITEAEQISLARCKRIVMCLLNFIRELGLSSIRTRTIFQTRKEHYNCRRIPPTVQTVNTQPRFFLFPEIWWRSRRIKQ